MYVASFNPFTAKGLGEDFNFPLEDVQNQATSVSSYSIVFKKGKERTAETFCESLSEKGCTFSYYKNHHHEVVLNFDQRQLLQKIHALRIAIQENEQNDSEVQKVKESELRYSDAQAESLLLSLKELDFDKKNLDEIEISPKLKNGIILAFLFKEVLTPIALLKLYDEEERIIGRHKSDMVVPSSSSYYLSNRKKVDEFLKIKPLLPYLIEMFANDVVVENLRNYLIGERYNLVDGLQYLSKGSDKNFELDLWNAHSCAIHNL